jgi:hypothetical protein
MDGAQEAREEGLLVEPSGAGGWEPIRIRNGIVLTKSRFLAGQQCAKRLWFEVHQPLEQRSVDGVSLVNGRAVDQMVHRLHPGVVVSLTGGIEAAVDETRRILAAGAPDVLYQGAFREGPLAVIADVIRRVDSASELVEVKAATEIQAEHVWDVAFQALVLERAGFPLSRTLLSYVDKRFVLRRLGDYHGLLVEQDVTAQVRAMLPLVTTDAQRFLDVIALPVRPTVPMGAQCEQPHVCPFIERCDLERGRRSGYPISILPRAGKLAAKLMAEGYVDLRDVPAARLTNPDHQRVHAATVSGQPIFNIAATAALRKYVPPFAYLDFETMNFAVPEVVGTSPYEQCPFQWSLHVEKDETLQHAAYLAIEEFGDFRQLAAELLGALPRSGPVFVYNATLEKGVLELLGQQLPSLSPELRDVIDRLVDLWPITKAAYYHPAMLGSWSLKDVLPTIDPALSYDTLEEIKEGEGAQLAFLELREGKVSESRRAELLRRLAQYCERDTYGMVVLRKFLCGQ